MGRPIGSSSFTSIDAVVGNRQLAGTVQHGFRDGLNVCYCGAVGTLADLSQESSLPPGQRGWYRICADRSKGKSHSGVGYSYSGTYNLSNRESVQYPLIELDNSDDPSYSGSGGNVNFTVYWTAIGPLDPSCVPEDPSNPGNPYFDSDEWYTVEVVADPANGGRVSGGGVFLKDSSCSIYALTNTGWRFDRWTSSGGETSYDPMHTFTVGGDVTWTAHFTQIEYTVTVEANPANGGTVSGGGTYHYNDYVNITATPSSGKFFIRWEASDGSRSDKASSWIHVTGDVTWTAIFKEGWLIKVKIVRGAQLGYFVTPDGWWDNTDPGHSKPLEVTEIESTSTSYKAVIAAKSFEPYSRVDNVFRIYLNDASKCEIALVRVIKGYRPGDYVPPYSPFDPLDRAVMNHGVHYSSNFNGADVEIYLRYKSTGELLHGSSGALLHGKNGDLLYL